MNLDWLDTFLDIYETHNFNQSAERLGLTQSTISHRIQSLEKSIGYQLFRRGRSGAEPTRYAHQFARHAERIVQEWSGARRAVSGTDWPQSEVRLGIQFDLARSHAPNLIARLRAEFPKTAFFAEVDYSAQMIRDVMRGDLDFAIVNTPKILTDLHFDPVGQLKYQMISSGGLSLKTITPSNYIFPNISPAFAETHRQTYPDLVACGLTFGQSDALAEVLEIESMATYVSAWHAERICARGKASRVTGACELYQNCYFICLRRHQKSSLFTRYRRAVSALDDLGIGRNA